MKRITQNAAQKAYTHKLQIMRAKLAKLNAQCAGLIGDGTPSDKIHWGHVGDLEHLNSILDEAIGVQLNHPKSSAS